MKLCIFKYAHESQKTRKDIEPGIRLLLRNPMPHRTSSPFITPWLDVGWPLTAPKPPSSHYLSAGAVHQEVGLPGVLHLPLLPPLPLPPPAGHAAPLANLRYPGQQHRAGSAHGRRTQASTYIGHSGPICWSDGGSPLIILGTATSLA